MRLRLAQILSKAGDAEGARNHLGDLLRKDPKDKSALAALAQLEHRAERWDAASATYRKLLALEEGEALVETALRLADTCDRAGRLPDARGGLERALRVAHTHPELRRWLRTIYNITGASRELAGFVLEDAAIAPDVSGRFSLLMQAGRLFLDSDDGADKAIEVLIQAQSLRPEDHEVTTLLGEALAAAARYDEARTTLSEAIALHRGKRSKQLAQLYHALSRVELADGNLDAYASALSRAFDIDPANSAFAMELGMFAFDIQDHDLATRAFRAITLMKVVSSPAGDGTSPQVKALAYFHLGKMALAQGDRRRARLMVEKATSEDQGLEEARLLLDELRTG
jgi:golgin subfamily B member 1